MALSNKVKVYRLSYVFLYLIIIKMYFFFFHIDDYVTSLIALQTFLRHLLGFILLLSQRFALYDLRAYRE